MVSRSRGATSPTLSVFNESSALESIRNPDVARGDDASEGLVVRRPVIVRLFLHKGLKRVKPRDDVGPETVEVRTPLEEATQHPVLGVTTRKGIDGARA